MHEEHVRTLRRWAEVETQRHINDIRHSPPGLAVERKVVGRHFSFFIKSAVVPIVCGHNLDLEGKLAALDAIAAGNDDDSRQCQGCAAVTKIDALAAAFFASQQRKGGKA